MKHASSIIDRREFVTIAVTANVAFEDAIMQTFGSYSNVTRAAFVVVQLIYTWPFRRRLKPYGVRVERALENRFGLDRHFCA